MAEQFYTILTNVGKASIANASATGTKVDFKYMALGDGYGSYNDPTEQQTELINEVYRSQINHIEIDEDNDSWITLSTVIPSNAGGFTVREVGVFDTEGNLLAVGKYPETYKPLVENGSSKDLTVNMILEVSNTSAVTLKIDPTVILATRKDVNNLAGEGRTTETVKNNFDLLSIHDESIASEEGRHGIRYWEEKLGIRIDGEYQDLELGSKIPIGNLLDLSASFGDSEATLSWKDPADLIVKDKDGQDITLAERAGTIIRRSTVEFPLNENEGEFVADLKNRDIGFKDIGLTNFTKYYYSLFPHTKDGYVVRSELNRVSVTPVPYTMDWSVGVQNAKIRHGFEEVTINFDLPDDPRLSGVMVRRSELEHPTSIDEGDLVYDGGATEVNDLNLINDKIYYYSIWAYSSDNQYSSPQKVVKLIGKPREFQTFGVRLDKADSNPETCLTYIGESIGFTPVNGTTKSLGSWGEFIDEYLSEYVTINLATKEELQQIDKNDFTKLKGGGNAVLDGSMGDLMWKIPKMYWKFEDIGDYVNVYLSTGKEDEDFVCLAHTKGATERDYIYYGVSLGVEQSGKLRSLGAGVPTNNKTISQFRAVCEANGTDVHMLPHYPWLLYQIILTILGKNLDTQTQWGNNHSSNTQNVNTNISKGYLFGQVAQGAGVNAFINDPWGNQWQWLDGFKYGNDFEMLVATKNFNDNATGYENVGRAAAVNGYMTKTQLTTKAGFSPKADGGSSSTYYCDHGSANAGIFPHVGGYAGRGASAGAFHWYCHSASHSNSSLSARIFMYGD